jgi:hypothetical protein
MPCSQSGERAGFDRPNIGTLIPPQKQPVK